MFELATKCDSVLQMLFLLTSMTDLYDCIETKHTLVGTKTSSLYLSIFRLWPQ